MIRPDRTGFLDQVLGTGILLFCIRGLTDEKNTKLPSFIQPFLFGLVVLNIGICFGLNVGYPINPARDLGARLFTMLVGYGTETFTAFSYWSYVPVVACHLGAIIGSLLYDILIGWHFNTEGQAKDENENKKKAIEEVITK